MTAAASLLPLNARPLERQVSELGAQRRAAFPSHLVGQVWDPATCDVAVLDWLANALSVDVWDPAWGELRKRAAIAASPRLHLLKGTLEGIAAHLVEAGAELRQAITPRARMFATPKVTKAQRDAWLARMPQIRVHLATYTGQAKADAFAGRSFFGAMFANPDNGRALYGRVAELHDNGQVTPLRRVEVETTTRVAAALQLDRVLIPGSRAPAAAFARRGFARRSYFAGPLSPPRIVTFALSRSYSHKASELHLSTVKPGLDPIPVSHERVSGAGQAGRAMFAGRAIGRRFAMADRAPWLLYDRVLLQDPKRDAPWVRAHSFAGHSRFPPAPFSATLLIASPGRLAPRAAVARTCVARRSFAAPRDLTAYRRAVDAVRVSKAFRDEVNVTAAATRLRQFGDRIPLDGSFQFGRQVPRTL